MNKRRFSALLLSVVLCLSLYSCTFNESTTEQASQKQITSISETSTFTEVTKESDVENVTNTVEETSTTESTTVKKSTSATAKKKTKNSKSNKKPTSVKKNISTTNDVKQTSASEKVCYITIDCTELTEHKDNLKAGHEDYLPESSYLAKNYKCPVKEDTTVYNALEYFCKSEGIKLTATNSPFGVYVSGINNLDEKDCGNSSGWKYYVNGTSPGVSCGKYKVNEGDKITFKFVLNP